MFKITKQNTHRKLKNPNCLQYRNFLSNSIKKIKMAISKQFLINFKLKLLVIYTVSQVSEIM